MVPERHAAPEDHGDEQFIAAPVSSCTELGPPIVCQHAYEDREVLAREGRAGGGEVGGPSKPILDNQVVPLSDFSEEPGSLMC